MHIPVHKEQRPLLIEQMYTEIVDLDSNNAGLITQSSCHTSMRWVSSEINGLKYLRTWSKVHEITNC